MKNKYYFFLMLFMVIFASCKSKKVIVATPTSPVILNPDAIRPGTAINTSGKFTPDQSQLKALDSQKKDVLKDTESQSKNKVEKEISNKPSDAFSREAKIEYSKKKVPSSNSGVEQIAQYDFTHPDVPESFDGFRIAFISDLHYKSLLKEKGLNDIVRLLIDQKPDVLLMGGDYQEGCEYVEPLFAALSKVKTPMGTYGIMGNNDYERCHDEIVRTMQRYGMHVLEHQVDTLRKNGQQIILAGVRNPFDLAKNGKSPTLSLSPDDFVIMLVHTPDYVEDVSVANTDLALAGHTHGGQVRIFGIAPILVSHYGSRFLTGLAYNSKKTPVIVTNGIGTSQKPIRIGAPAEIVMITLRRMKGN